jgi:hypothetical protein
MESSRLFLGLLAVDLLLGFVMGWSTARTPAPAEDAAVPSLVDLAGGLDTSLLDERAELDVDQLRERVAELERDVALYTRLERTYEVELHGEPPAWPEELEEKYSAAGFQAIVEQAARDCDLGMDLVGFDCGEPPCYAHFVGARQEADLGTCPAWVDAFGGSTSSASNKIDCDDGTSVRTHLVAPDMDFLWDPGDEERGFDANSWKRFSTRTRDAQLALACPQDGGAP